MLALETDMSGFHHLELDLPPVGVKFEFFKPEKLEQLGAEKKLSFCEMLAEAQYAKAPFYFSRENHETCVGKILLGMEEMEAFAESGQIGVRLGIFQDARGNHVFYQHVPRFGKDTINYVAFASLNNLNFEPDVLILTVPPDKADIVLRGVTYSTGEMYSSFTTPVMGCAWSFIYPYLSGKVNHLLPAVVHGMKGRRLFPDNTVLISIPFQWLPTVARNLQKMQIHLPGHRDKESYYKEFEGIIADLIEKSKQP